MILYILSLFISLFGVFHGFFYFIPYWISLAFINFVLLINSGSSLSDYYMSFYVLCFNLFSIIVSLFLSKLVNHRTFFCDSNHDDIKDKFSLGFVFSLLGCLAYVVGAGGVDGVVRSWVDIAVGRSLFELVISNFAQLFFLLGLALFFFDYFKNRNLSSLLLILLFGLIFLVLTRVKAYLLPVVLPFVVFYINDNRKRIYRLIFSSIFFGTSGVVLYFLTTLIRWMGGVDGWTFEKFTDVLTAVIEKGIERNFYYQSSFIFEYYLNNEIIYGQSYYYFFNPILRLFGFELENPMYVYHRIIYGASEIMKGSAHPGIYIDAFANFYVFGAFVSFFWMSVILFFYKIIFCRSAFLRVCYLVLVSYCVPLIVRGSVYYGLFYMILFSFFIVIFCFLTRVFQRKF